MTRTLLLTLLATACGPQKPYTTLDSSNWSTPLDGDLKVAVQHLPDGLKDLGYPNVHVMWAGARKGEYELLRGPTGELVRKYAQIAYAFQLPDGKCYIDMDFSTLGSGPMLVRESEHGSYAEPRITGYAPPKGGYGGRHEITCDAVTTAKTGVHEPF
jgi:hypothetical protein